MILKRLSIYPGLFCFAVKEKEMTFLETNNLTSLHFRRDQPEVQLTIFKLQNCCPVGIRSEVSSQHLVACVKSAALLDFYIW